MQSGESACGLRGAIAPLIPCRGRICGFVEGSQARGRKPWTSWPNLHPISRSGRYSVFSAGVRTGRDPHTCQFRLIFAISPKPNLIARIAGGTPKARAMPEANGGASACCAGRQRRSTRSDRLSRIISRKARPHPPVTSLGPDDGAGRGT